VILKLRWGNELAPGIFSILEQLQQRFAHRLADSVEPDRAGEIVILEVAAYLVPERPAFATDRPGGTETTNRRIRTRSYREGMSFAAPVLPIREWFAS
jgi:hypothetical protein